LKAPPSYHSRCSCLRTRWSACLLLSCGAFTRPPGSPCTGIHHWPRSRRFVLLNLLCHHAHRGSLPYDTVVSQVANTSLSRFLWNRSPSDRQRQSAILRATRDTLRGVLKMHLTDMASPSQAYRVMMGLLQQRHKNRIQKIDHMKSCHSVLETYEASRVMLRA